MQAKETLEMIGRLKIEIFGEDGALKQVADVPNLVVNAGKGFIASRMTGTAAAVMSHMAVGTSSTSPAGGDTALGAEVARVALTSGTTSGAIATYVASFPAGTGTGGLQEAGLFNDSTTGTMLCRTTFSVINKGASDSMTITWTVTVS